MTLLTVVRRWRMAHTDRGPRCRDWTLRLVVDDARSGLDAAVDRVLVDRWANRCLVAAVGYGATLIDAAHTDPEVIGGRWPAAACSATPTIEAVAAGLAFDLTHLELGTITRLELDATRDEHVALDNPAEVAAPLHQLPVTVAGP